ncbi:MAG: serine/threonine protein phosphatase [Peptoniphilus harei]|uniref:serine/threonine protein phosphatase n=1 Tax=Peptoniphilus harei TaxID=54005 RepID=UPI002907205D|nr:serine/threonine protein phosphatase [Peptoniphilus harei]MDU5470903.1 serine/threonine protein phosphatase [Peptoniphilus harei]MDU6099017.1 serine/threonine protein phosphatase [Peptoniphilus harei]
MISESIMEKLENEYIARFRDLFPNMGISREYEKEIILTCLDKGKDTYELGYFDLEKYY